MSPQLNILINEGRLIHVLMKGQKISLNTINAACLFTEQIVVKNKQQFNSLQIFYFLLFSLRP